MRDFVDIEHLLDSFRRSVFNYCQNPSPLNQAEFEKLIYDHVWPICVANFLQIYTFTPISDETKRKCNTWGMLVSAWCKYLLGRERSIVLWYVLWYTYSRITMYVKQLKWKFYSAMNSLYCTLHTLCKIPFVTGSSLRLFDIDIILCALEKKVQVSVIFILEILGQPNNSE